MPFTATHVAAAVPVAWLCGWRVPFSALAIGAMIPDGPVFFPALFDYESTHSLLGIFTHCLPSGILAYYIYHALLKQPLVDLMPPRYSARMRAWAEKPIDFSPRQLAVVIACVTIGAMTHIFWDAFTHRGRWGVSMLPALQSVALEHQGRSVRWYDLLQHGSSIVLLPPLLLGFALWIRKQPLPSVPLDRSQMPRTVSWTAIALLVVGTMIYYQTLVMSHPNRLWITNMSFAVKHGGAVALAVALLYCCAMHLVWWRERLLRFGGAERQQKLPLQMSDVARQCDVSPASHRQAIHLLRDRREHVATPLVAGGESD